MAGKDGVRVFLLSSAETGVSDEVVSLNVRVIPDEPPSVLVFSPGEDIPIGEDMIVPLGVLIQDDYGVGGANLVYVHRGDTQKVGLSIDKAKRVEVYKDWDTEMLNFLPGETIYYWVSAKDNAIPPHTGISRIYFVYFPSVVEFYEEMVGEVEGVSGEMGEGWDAFREFADGVSAHLEDLFQQGKGLQEGDWDELLDKGKEAGKRLGEVLERLTKMAEMVENNPFFDEEVRIRMEHINCLLYTSPSPRD